MSDENADQQESEEINQQRRWEKWGNYPQEQILPDENQARLETHQLRSKMSPRPNPTDFKISLRAKYGTDQQIAMPGSKRRQSMRGFEDTYVDIIDFIVRATHRIWEEKDIGYIYDHYRHNIRVVDDYGLNVGRDLVIANTTQFLNAFPDIRLIADEIIWAGNDEVGFYTSHRTMVIGTNTGYSQFGPPTGRRVKFWLTANCLFIANENYEEWVIYNTSSMLRQMGYDLKQKAREFANARPGTSLAHGFGEPNRLLGQHKPPHLPAQATKGFDVDYFLRDTLHYVWNWRMLSKIYKDYSRNFRFFGPTDRQLIGLGDYQSFVLAMLSMFPDLVLEIDDLYWMGNDEEGYVTSTRWHMVGTHRGWGFYGPPTGRRITIWGITQHLIEGGKILEEWMTFNEFDVMQQIYRDEPFDSPA